MSMAASHVTTHVLDSATGKPAAGVLVALEDAAGATLASAATDDDGRVASLGPELLEPGDYRLVFGTGAYFAARGQETFFPEVGIVFRVLAGAGHYHVPLLLSPFAYSTYRGS
jgi:5-hydroxyisourate hydrolase